MPRSNVPVRFGSEMEEPAMFVHVLPFVEVAAVYVVPLRVMRRYFGTVPAIVTWLVTAPDAVRHWTAMPLAGVTNTA